MRSSSLASSKKLLEAAAEAQHVERERAHDRELASLRLQLSIANQKYKAATADLENTQRTLECALLMDGNKQSAKFEKLAKNPNSESSAIVVLNDWHAEETVDPDTINGLNEFNLDIAAKRIERTFQKIPELLDSFSKFTRIRQLVLAMLGDMITGYLHPELEESNGLSPTEASLFVHDQLRAGINFLIRSKCVESIVAPCTDGNHGRTTHKPRHSTRYKNSHEWLLYHHLAKSYRDEPKIAFKIEKGIHNWLTIQGHDVRFQHGDNIKYQGGVGGISIPVNKAIAQWNISRRAALDVFGHWHQSIQTDKWVCCNCLIGYSAHALSIKAAFERPAQTLIVMSKEHGKVLAMNIHCE